MIKNYIDNNNISTEGSKEIAESLKINTSINSINLSNITVVLYR